jgi:hypothetical protein
LASALISVGFITRLFGMLERRLIDLERALTPTPPMEGNADESMSSGRGRGVGDDLGYMG